MHDQDHTGESPARHETSEHSGVACPFCGSCAVELISLFGGQLSTDQYYCRACRSYFERFSRDAERADEHC